MNENGTGIVYPTLTLAGVEYTLKFTRGAMVYRMSKAGVSIADLSGPKSFSALIDILHVAMPTFSGSIEDLADLVLSENKTKEASEALTQAMGKVFPPTHQPEVAAGPSPVQ